MPFCPSCGRQVSESARFCPKCGFVLEPGVIAVPPTQPPPVEAIGWDRKNWFERHLNWTMVLTWVGIYPVFLLAVLSAALADPTLSEGTATAIGAGIGLLVPIPVAYWVLRKKKRSMWWLLICHSVFFLLVSNKSSSREGN